MPPFRVFISSPVYGIPEYRSEVIGSLQDAASSGMFEFFYYEAHEIEILDGMSICQSIFNHCGNDFDAAYFFFKDRVGDGTREEFDHFQNVLKPRNPDCQLWWTQIHCDNHDEMTGTLLADIHTVGGNLGLWRRDGKMIDTPDILASVLTAKLWNTAAAMRNGEVTPFGGDD